eukprot:5500387-Karenia_brevis.AAC.1
MGNLGSLSLMMTRREDVEEQPSDDEALLHSLSDDMRLDYSGGRGQQAATGWQRGSSSSSGGGGGAAGSGDGSGFKSSRKSSMIPKESSFINSDEEPWVA